VGAASVAELDRHAAPFKPFVGTRQPAGGQGRHGVLRTRTERGTQRFDMVVAAVAQVGLGLRMGDDLGARRLEAAVAQPALILPAVLITQRTGCAVTRRTASCI
jgi:hypothetical protein